MISIMIALQIIRLHLVWIIMGARRGRESKNKGEMKEVCKVKWNLGKHVEAFEPVCEWVVV